LSQKIPFSGWGPGPGDLCQNADYDVTNKKNGNLKLFNFFSLQSRTVLFNLFVIVEPLTYFRICHGTCVNKKEVEKQEI